MRYGELARKLQRLGCEFYRPAKGGHEVWKNAANGRRTVIPHHASGDLSRGIVHAILRDLGFTESDLEGV